MTEGGAGLESFAGAPGGQEMTKEQHEQFQEQYRQNQAAAKQVRAEEKKAKQQDDMLAGLISQFLKNGNRGAHFLLIARLLAKNIPSDLILALISLIEPAAQIVIKEKLAQLPKAETSSDKKGGIFPAKVKANIDLWTNGINAIAVHEARRLVKTAIEPDGNHNPGLTQLFTLVLREFLENYNVKDIPTKNINAFGDLFFQRVFAQLKKMTGDEYQIKANN